MAFALDGQAPRVLVARDEIAVPFTVTNTGQRAWDPARVHFSYHWLWMIPRELAHRTRTLPYQDGIRTELGSPVAPGARIALHGRLLAPDHPGFYWLQWDMVEENITWFAQVSPRQPRSLVVILPTLAGFFAPIPLIAALAGLFAIRRFAAADVVWCAATLLSKQLLLFEEATLEPTEVAYWLAVVAAVLLPVLAMTALPRRLRAPVLFVVGAFGSVLMLADIVYYRYFGDMLSASALLAIRQTGQVTASIRSLLTPDLIWLVVDLPFAFWLAMRLARRHDAEAVPAGRRAGWALAVVGVLAAAGLAVSVPRELASSPLDQMFRARSVVEDLSPFGYHAYDAWNALRATRLREAATPAQVDLAALWFSERARLRSGQGSPFFGQARGKNLIVVQVESLQDFAVDYRVANQDVMPHLRRWTSDAFRFTDVTDQTNEGRTSDAEFVAMTSLLPLDHGAVAFHYPTNHYVGFPRVLTEHGYTTLSAVAFEAGFWNRRVMHPSYGFGESLFEPDFTMTEQIGWGLNDRDFLKQMVPRLEALPRPFCAWLITLSLHHPFDGFPDRHKVLKLGALEGTPFGNYLHTMRFFDDALEQFTQALVRDRLLDDTVVMVFGDHDAGFAHDAGMARRLGIAQTEAAWAAADRVPWFVRMPASVVTFRDVRHVIGTPAGQADFAPTLLALLGIDPASLPYMGRNLLGAPDDPPILRPYGDWLDRAHLFVNRGTAGRTSICYASDSALVVDRRACEAENIAARQGRDVSKLVIADDLQERLRATLAQRIQ